MLKLIDVIVWVVDFSTKNHSKFSMVINWNPVLFKGVLVQYVQPTKKHKYVFGSDNGILRVILSSSAWRVNSDKNLHLLLVIIPLLDNVVVNNVVVNNVHRGRVTASDS